MFEFLNKVPFYYCELLINIGELAIYIPHYRIGIFQFLVILINRE